MKIYSTFLFLAIFLTTSTPVYSQNTLSVFDTNLVQVDNVMQQYFSALSSGNLQALKSTLGGKLLSKREKLLGNPSYSVHLQSMYKDAQFTILKKKIVRSSLVSVDVLVTLGSNETIQKQYQLKQSKLEDGQTSFLIISESAVSQPMQ